MANRRKHRSTRPRRQLARRILVVTEGTRTEPQYVEGLNNHLRGKGVAVSVKTVSVGKDPLKVVEKCVQQRNKAEHAGEEKAYDDCVCLVDVDEHKSLPDAIALANQEAIHLLISNLKFEVWLRWHAEEKRSALTSAQLDELVAKLGLAKTKRLSNSFPYSAVDRACEVARIADPGMCSGRKGPDPSSAMPILVDLMRGEHAQP